MKPRTAPASRETPRARPGPRSTSAGKTNPDEIDVRHLVHELRVNQMELEMQNEELRRIQAELEVSRDSYLEFYESAPIGYLVLDQDGLITACNMTAARMLGACRADLLRKNIGSYVAAESQDTFVQHRQHVLSTGMKQTCDLILRPSGGGTVVVAFECAPLTGKPEAGRQCMVAMSDITPRWQAEKSRELFRALIDRSNDKVEVIDPESGRYLDCNSKAFEALGYTREELLALTIFDVAPRFDRESYAQTIASLRQTGGLIFEDVHRRKDRTTFPVEVSLAWVTIDRDYVLATVRDITERKAAGENRARFAAIVDSSDDAIISYTLDGSITSWNQSAERLFGYPAEEAVGRPIGIIVPQERAAERDQIQQKLRWSVPMRSFETLRRRKDGTLIPVSESTSPLRNELGHVVGASAIIRDNTRRNAMEALLRTSEQDLADFFEESPLGLMWVGPEGRVERVNRAYLDIVGRTNDEVRGKSVADCFIKSELATHLMQRLARRETVHDTRARLRHRDGTTRHVLIDANGRWRDDTLVHSRWFVRDVTQRINLQREVLAIAERERRRLGHDLHDDVCQHLSGIQFLSDTLAGVLDGSSEDGARRAREIGRLTGEAIDRARELAHGLSPMSLEHDGLLTALRSLAVRTRQIFRRDCRFLGEETVVVNDPTVSAHLYHIAQEAVNNAVRHGKARSIEINLSGSAGHVALAVRDDGVGIPLQPRKRRGMGLQVMHYRAGVIDANLVVQRRARGGTEVICTIGHGEQ